MFLTLSCLLAIGAATAAPITEHQAREIASRFMANHSPSLNFSSGVPAIALTPVSSRSGFYVFNSAVADKGFVIIAGDDRLPAVLGYSDSGSFDADDVPPVMQEWLDGYAAQVEAIAAGAAPEVRTVSRPAIAPMLPVHWGQGMPYGMLLPHVEGSTKAHAVVGCVGTAMSQVMAYWRYPPRPTQTIPGYTSDDGTHQITMPPLEPIDFDWENMCSIYYVNDSTSAASMAVANLMLYCASSLQSNYGQTSTSSTFYDIPERLITYFGYKNSARTISRMSFNTQAWEDSIYSELAKGCPVAYCGSKLSAAAHAFVCDGYDGEGRFHINWGWEGKSNGYFFLNLLSPEYEGIGSASGNYSYIQGQAAAIGLSPSYDNDEGIPALSFENLTILSSKTTRTSASANFSVKVGGSFVNNTNVPSQFVLGWGLYSQDGNLVNVLDTRETSGALGYRESLSVSSLQLSFGAGITSGIYRIIPIYSIPGENIYRPCIGSDVKYIKVTFKDAKTCTILGYGTPGLTAQYTVNSCTVSGTRNHGKPLTVKLNVTNSGNSTYDMIYMYVDGVFTSMGLANIEAGKRDDIIYRYTPTTAGTKTLSFSLKQSAASAFYSQDVVINTMPSAKLDVSFRILNITDEAGRVITADRYSIIADVTNSGTETYNEDFAVRLLRVTNDETNSGTEMQSLMQPLYLPVGESKSLQFDFDHDLVNGCKYYCLLCYYSNGTTVSKGTKWYYLNLTDDPMVSTLYRVTTNADPVEGGNVQLSGHILVGSRVETGETVTVTPKPNIGWLSSGVTVTDSIGNPIEVVEAGNGTYSFVMPDRDVHVTVNFKSMPRVTAQVEPSEGGDVQLSGNFVDNDKIMAGETVTVTPIPDTGWDCSGVTVTDTIGNAIEVVKAEEGTYTFVMPDSDVNVTVYFETMPYIFTNKEPSYGGDVKLSGRVFVGNQFKVGETVTIIPVPNVGWRYSGMAVVDTLGNPVEIIEQGDGTYTFVMPRSDINVTVNFVRSTGNLFELVQGESDFTADATYILVNRNNNKVMKRWSDTDTTFLPEAIVEWLDDSKGIVRVDDDACFFTMSGLSDTITNSSSMVFKAAYLTTRNGYISVAGNNSTNVLLNNHIVPQSRVWMQFVSISSRPTPILQIHFSSYKLNYYLNYDTENDAFKLMSLSLSATNPRYVDLYKLVEAYSLTTDFDSARGLVTVTGGMVDGTAQRGETVTFAVSPNEGYTTSTVQITTASGEVIAAGWDEATGSYSFIMPAEDVTISAAFDVSTEPDFILGDVDRDGDVTISDLTALIDYILGNTVDIDLNAADVNADGIIDIADATGLIDMLLSN